MISRVEVINRIYDEIKGEAFQDCLSEEMLVPLTDIQRIFDYERHILTEMEKKPKIKRVRKKSRRVTK